VPFRAMLLLSSQVWKSNIMMILRSSPPSPFGRKVKLALGILGLEKDVTIEKADPTDVADSIRQQNPIGKIPALITEDGTVLYDSPVILEYLDHRAGGGKILPKDMNARIKALTLQALGDGILDAGILLVYEGRWRPPEMAVQKWIEHQTGKVTRAMATLEANTPALSDVPDVGQITLACALGYGDLRFGGKWREGHPKLVKWLDAFAAKVPAFEKTKVTA
jgi:glutathione S-transferase